MDIHRLLYKLGEQFRNPQLASTTQYLIEADFISMDELRTIQRTRLRKLLVHAKKYSPYWKKRLAGINVDGILLDDLPQLPTLNKQDLHKHCKEIQNNPFSEKLIKSETSGTTGDTLVFYRTKQWDTATRAAQHRGYSWYGVRPWEKNLYFWGFDKKNLKIRVLDYLLNRFRFFSYDEDEFRKAALFLYKCSYVEGYSSAIYSLSEYLSKAGFTYNNIKLVKGTSEKIYDYYHQSSKNVFGHKIVSEYGATETGIIAFECPLGHMHIAMENVIVEEINNRIVATNLHSHSFPIIRYELGDYILLDNNTQCDCGRAHTILKEVTGRVGKKIYGLKSSYPTLTLYYIFKNIALVHGIKLAYFGKQNKKGELTIEVMANSDIDKNRIIDLIHEQSSKYYDNDVNVIVDFKEEIERKTKKITDFESYIDR